MVKILVVIDMQNDFVTGVLGTKEAQNILPKVEEKIRQYRVDPGNVVIFTKDTHDENYLETQEGKNLPVKHCIKDTDGWQLVNPDWNKMADNIIDKNTFGSVDMAVAFSVYESLSDYINKIEEIEVVGVCTGICVIANAVLLKTILPEIQITVDASCCACVTPETHKRALESMKLLQIKVVNE